MSVTAEIFGDLPDGRPVRLFRLDAGGGVKAAVSEYGAALVTLMFPDRDGNSVDIVLGFDDLAGYVADSHYLGVVVGRYANRISRGRFDLDGRPYTLACNDGPNHLHGGVRGFGKCLWTGTPGDNAAEAKVVLTRRSPDGEEGYPGALDVSVSYTLGADDRLSVDFRATTDRPTVVNLASHAYFNLAGRGNVLEHQLRLYAERFMPLDETSIPTGEILSVAGTPFDFRTRRVIGERIADGHPPFVSGAEYDHNFVADGLPGTLRPVAELWDQTSGRRLEVHSTQPGVQFYAGNHLAGLVGRSGTLYGRHAGLCLETQHFPDSPNQPQFPSTRLAPGETYDAKVEFRLTTE